MVAPRLVTKAHQSNATTAEARADRSLGSAPKAAVRSAHTTLVQDETTDAMSGACGNVSRKNLQIYIYLPRQQGR